VPPQHGEIALVMELVEGRRSVDSHAQLAREHQQEVVSPMTSVMTASSDSMPGTRCWYLMKHPRADSFGAAAVAARAWPRTASPWRGPPHPGQERTPTAARARRSRARSRGGAAASPCTAV